MATPETQRRFSDRQVEQFIGRVLQAGVLLAAGVVVLGATLLLQREGGEVADFRTFAGPAGYLRSVGGVVSAAMGLDPYAVVQLGLLLLVATPVARVALTLVAFAIQRDRLYVAMTGLVLALLLAGLVFGIGA